MSSFSDSFQVSQATRGSVHQTERGTIYVNSPRNEYRSKSSDYENRGRRNSWQEPRSKPAISRPVKVSYSTFGSHQNEYMPLLSAQEPCQREWIVEPVESGFLRLVQNFDFKWYGSTMGTGIVSILLFTFSNIYAPASSILFQLSVVFYGLNVLLFSTIFTMTVLRYFLYPKLFTMLVSDPGQAMYLGTFPMGFATIISMTVNVMVPRFGGCWAQVSWVFWWIDVAVSMATALGVPWLL